MLNLRPGGDGCVDERGLAPVKGFKDGFHFRSGVNSVTLAAPCLLAPGAFACPAPVGFSITLLPLSLTAKYLECKIKPKPWESFNMAAMADIQ